MCSSRARFCYFFCSMLLSLPLLFFSFFDLAHSAARPLCLCIVICFYIVTKSVNVFLRRFSHLIQTPVYDHWLIFNRVSSSSTFFTVADRELFSCNRHAEEREIEEDDDVFYTLHTIVGIYFQVRFNFMYERDRQIHTHTLLFLLNQHTFACERL